MERSPPRSFPAQTPEARSVESAIRSMVKRCESSRRCKRWLIYFPNKPQAGTSKRILSEVVAAGRARVTFHEVSNCRVELVWETGVTIQSAMRLVGQATARGKAFEILGAPTGIFDEGEAVDVPATLRRVADPKRRRIDKPPFQPYAVSAQVASADTAKASVVSHTAASAPAIPLSSSLALKLENLVHFSFTRRPHQMLQPSQSVGVGPRAGAVL